MEIIQCSPEMEYDRMYCPSTDEVIFAPDYEEINEGADAFIAYWHSEVLDEPCISDEPLEKAWNEYYEKCGKTLGITEKWETVEKFLCEYENPLWKVYECIACELSATTVYYVVKADTIIEEGLDFEEEEDEEVKEDLKIEKIETFCPIFCPFCGELISGDEEDGPCFYESGNCEHLLFVATDCGFEKFSDRFCENMNIDPENTNLDVAPGYSHIDEFTDNVTIPGSIKYAIYEGIGDSLGAYYGFAPIH